MISLTNITRIRRASDRCLLFSDLCKEKFAMLTSLGGYDEKELRKHIDLGGPTFALSICPKQVNTLLEGSD
jgi:hypothetical protein